MRFTVVTTISVLLLVLVSLQNRPRPGTENHHHQPLGGGLMIGAEAQTYHPSGVRRGAYMSLYGYKIGNLYLEFIANTDLYYILGNQTREQIALNFFQHWNFNALVFYNLYVIWTSPTLTASLQSFMERCRGIGITNIEATGSEWMVDYDELKKYNDQVATNDDQKFDGLVTEIEFWHSKKMSDITDALEYARAKNIGARAGKKFYYCTYLGPITDSQVVTLLPLIDYFWPHAYNKDTTKYYPMTESRLEGLVKALGGASDKTVLATPIFSAESSKYSAYKNAWFGGDALEQRGNFSAIEEEYKADWEKAIAADPTGAPPINLLTGYQWYEYCFFYLVMKDLTPTPNITLPPPTPAPPTPIPPPTPAPPATCTSSADCPCSYCKDDSSRTPPYYCHGTPCFSTATTTSTASPATTVATTTASTTTVATTTAGTAATTAPLTTAATTTPSTTAPTTTVATITPSTTPATTQTSPPSTTADDLSSSAQGDNKGGDASCGLYGGAGVDTESGDDDEFDPWMVIAIILILLFLVLLGIFIHLKMQANGDSKRREATHKELALDQMLMNRDMDEQ